MREIKFRGLYENHFVFGNLICGIVDGRKFYEIEHSDSDDFHKWEVMPGTIGQYTGLKGKNGQEIFEGDIVKLTGSGEDPEIVISDITFGCHGVCVNDGKSLIRIDMFCGDFKEKRIQSTVEIIGNIHKNPELIA